MPPTRTAAPDQVALALREVFVSPNVSDSNWEPANLVDAVSSSSYAIARAVDRLAVAAESIAAALRDRRD